MHGAMLTLRSGFFLFLFLSLVEDMFIVVAATDGLIVTSPCSQP